MKIVCIGAGVANCIILRSLRDYDAVETVCLEQSGRGEHTNSGTGLNIGPNAMAALCETDNEMCRKLLDASFHWKHWKVSLVTGRVLFDLPLSRLSEHCGIRIRWAELYRILRDEIDSAIQYGSQVVGVGYDDHGMPFVEYERGGVLQKIDNVDLVIAGDGRYSLIRRELVGEASVSLFGVAIGRLLITDADDALIDDYEQWFHGANRLLAFRVPPNDVYVALTFPLPPSKPIPETVSDGAFLRKLYEPDGEASPTCRWLIDHIVRRGAEIHWARFQDAPPAFYDRRERALFVGDAAHPMLPTLGQGATQAIEDGCVAAKLLDRHLGNDQHAAGWQSRLMVEFRRAREERIRFVMQFSRDAADTLLANSDAINGTLDKMKPHFLSRLRQLYTDVRSVQEPDQ